MRGGRGIRRLHSRSGPSGTARLRASSTSCHETSLKFWLTRASGGHVDPILDDEQAHRIARTDRSRHHVQAVGVLHAVDRPRFAHTEGPAVGVSAPQSAGAEPCRSPTPTSPAPAVVRAPPPGPPAGSGRVRAAGRRGFHRTPARPGAGPCRRPRLSAAAACGRAPRGRLRHQPRDAPVVLRPAARPAGVGTSSSRTGA